jgi:hypothetical protein
MYSSDQYTDTIGINQSHDTNALNGTRLPLLSHFFLFLLPDQRLYIVNNVYMHITLLVSTMIEGGGGN